MSDLMHWQDQWQQQNAEHLAAGVAWLRALLAQVAEAPSPDAFQEVGARLAPSSAVERARAALKRAEACDPPPALLMLARRLGLTEFESSILLLCVAMELDTSMPLLCARAQHDAAKPFPTFALALAVFDDPAWEALSPERPLRYWRLVEATPSETQPLITSALRADEQIVHYLKGLHILDERLAALLTPMPPLRMALPPSQHAQIEEVVASLQRAARSGALAAVQLTGPHSGAKRTVALEAAIQLGMQLLALEVDTLPAAPAELESLARLWQRESLLSPLALYVDAGDADPAGPAMLALRRLLARQEGIVLVAVRESVATLASSGAPLPVVEIALPTVVEQRGLWQDALGVRANGASAQLAAHFDLDPAAIAQAALSIQGAEGVDEELAQDEGLDHDLADRIWNQCRSASRPRMEALAQRLVSRATWDDLVLPAETTALLHQMTDQVRHRLRVYDDWGFRAKMSRGLGISALFAGESGTGKTMTAEVIANDLRLDLYRIDLSAVVSKYIGDTEKNLRRVFDAAEEGGVLLFFDEADALFGRRSEVKDSHDRYANIEVNYLLQRMEEYRGLAVLATNMKGALDPAFTRRLRFIVNFAFPALPERRRMWQKVFPPQAPVAELDVEQLARLNLTGGLIRNIALNAAFLAAAQEPAQITMPIVREAIRVELRKLDRPVNGV